MLPRILLACGPLERVLRPAALARLQEGNFRTPEFSAGQAPFQSYPARILKKGIVCQPPQKSGCVPVHALPATVISPAVQTSTIKSISTRTSFGRRDTSAVDLAGGFCPKYFPYTSFIAGKSFMSFK